MDCHYQRVKKRKIVAVVSYSSIDGSVSYVSNPKKLCRDKIDNNLLNPDGALFMLLYTTKCNLADKSKGHSRC